MVWLKRWCFVVVTVIGPWNVAVLQLLLSFSTLKQASPLVGGWGGRRNGACGLDSD
jgi:hypothetical protein